MLILVSSTDAIRNNLVTKPRLPLWKVKAVLDAETIPCYYIIPAHDMTEAMCKAAAMFKKAISIAVSMT